MERASEASEEKYANFLLIFASFLHPKGYKTFIMPIALRHFSA